jgi:hypothetical protein
VIAEFLRAVDRRNSSLGTTRCGPAGAGASKMLANGRSAQRTHRGGRDVRFLAAPEGAQVIDQSGSLLVAQLVAMALRASPAKRGCIAMTMRYDTPPDDGIDTFETVGNCWRIIARNEAS